MSEFGYEYWCEMVCILSLLRKERFPIDGFALDLQWYGGEFFFTDDGWKVNEGRRRGRMGTLGFDERAGRFDRAADTIRRLKEKEGLELMLIEQSYIGANLDKERAKKEKDLVCWNDNAHAEMANRGFLIRQRSADGPPVYLTGNPWWGQGSMIDWLIPEAGDFWHDMKRKPLLALGIRSHWPDLGEPEMFDPGDWSRGIEPGKHEHQDYHNLYAFKWYESIARGYSRHQEKRRHYIMGRSGTVGIQRFGVGMWSGDIGARIANLTAGVNSRVLHMPFSGMDYLSSDIGGFHRWSLDSSLKSLYTQWFATACLLEFPVRPHVWNLSNEPSKHNDPVRVGHLASNLSNLRRRYELVPYYYSLAHKAYLYGDPVVAPLVYYFGEDTHLRHIGEEAMVGPDLLAATMANGERWEYEKKVYLPKGTWVEYNGHDYFRSNGGWTSELPAYRNGTVTLPLFARSGAIIPKAKVDEQTMNVFGKRLDGSVANDWIVRVFADEKETRFTLFEDDGDTVQYRDSEPKVRTTVLTQKKDGNHAQLTIDGSRGSYTGAPEKRPVTVELVAENAQAESVSLKAASRSRSLAQCPSQKAFEMAEECFFNAGNNLVVAKIKPEKATEPKTFDFHLESQPRASVFFICNNATTAPGESIYVSGDIRELGQWNPSQALRLGPDPYTPQATLTWAGVVTDLPIRTPFQWKCLKRVEEQGGQVLQWQPGENYTFSTRQGFSGKAVGGF
ncbi:MAG: DUF5110 domain-containing protein [Deltaproteobacteria bacterium]|nr:DUF5110 domain-containing protein [Deltaproteobacteria bacterium]